MTQPTERPLGVRQASTPRWVRIWSVPAMVLAGALVSLQSQVTGTLRLELGEGIRAAGLASVIGTGGGLALLAPVMLLNPALRAGAGRVLRSMRRREHPWWTFVGGLFGGFFVLSQAVAVSVVGVAMFAVAAVAGQTASALAVDRLGFGPAGMQRITRPRVVAAAFAVTAVVVASLGGLAATDRLPLAALAFVLLPFAAGAGSALQQAINGRVTTIAGALPSTLLNFALGTTFVAVFLAVGMLFEGSLGPLPSQWWLYTSGLIGLLLVWLSAALVHVHGVLTLMLCVIAGQVLGAEVLNAVSPTAQVTAYSLLATVLVVIGVLVGLFAGRRRTRTG